MTKQVVKFAFFDLDNTLVDQSGALREWAEQFVADRGIDPAAVDFLAVKSTTAKTWTEYASDFKRHFGLADSVEQLVHDVTMTYPHFFVLDDAVSEGLRRLRAEGWRLGVITNGATTMQNAKIDRVRLRGLVDGVFVSETEGARKPERLIFERAAAGLGVQLDHPYGWMVGDSLEADIAGGIGAGLRTIWVQNERALTAEDPQPHHVCGSVADALKLLADA
ncbi:HAD family hydrolase [Actinocrinis puniceicyclus]|uniref:HAD family hydrolase n=1 Tax=Actinocrinis puniceicyclus TaxID=977794 RepID=A0A8J7WR05_9ACTN|nr:HAD family hydrolase [Actinocrinis puniceicyclus]MBS2965120.1 HAD family hydrolase [Actinocrinis puniceicyclus]